MLATKMGFCLQFELDLPQSRPHEQLGREIRNDVYRNWFEGVNKGYQILWFFIVPIVSSIKFPFWCEEQ